MKLGQALVERYDGEVPGRMADLVTLPGIGRKTANVILGNAFDVPGLTVDTHFQRLVHRWEWTGETDPVKIEIAVGQLIERREWTMLVPPDHLPRPPGLPRPQAGLRRVHAGALVPVVRYRPDRPGRGRKAAQGTAGRRAGRPRRGAGAGRGHRRRGRQRGTEDVP